MIGFSDSESSLQRRAAYTLLELMLALALLGALMTVAWSLMGTYRDAEQRGWKLSHRTQTIRAAREWLQSDVQHLLQNEPSIANSPANKSRLNGNPLGFTASIAPSLNPLPFLENIMLDSLDNPRGNDQAESIASPFSESESDAEVAEAQQSLWPPETMEVEYQLTPIEDRSATTESYSLPPADLNSVQFSLTRREMMDASTIQSGTTNFDARSFSQNNLADKVLTAQDLYRQKDPSTKSRGVAIRETRLDGLTHAQFLYFDGQSWLSDWNSDQAGGLPRAIALSFDFPARADMKPIASTSAEESESDRGVRESNSTLGRKDYGSQLSFADTALAAEPSIGNSARGETGLMQSTTHEIQIVVYVGGNAGGSQRGFK